MPRPSIDADVEGIGGSHRLRRISAIVPDEVEKRASPRIVGEETMQVAAERAPVAPADLGASLAYERLALLRDRVATSVADLVAPQVEAEHGPGARRAALLCPLLRFEDGGDGQQAEPRPRVRTAFGAGSVVEAPAEHLITATEAQYPSPRAMRLADSLRDAGRGVVHEVRQRRLRCGKDYEILLRDEPRVGQPAQVHVRLREERRKVVGVRHGGSEE